MAPPHTDTQHAARIGLHLGLAALPLLAISAQVFGLLSMRTAAALVVIPLVLVVGVVSVFDPHGSDRVVWRGLLWGMFACLIYDAFRLDTVYLLGWWGDFIPTMGTWITGSPDSTGGAVVGYLWRYVGDGGGIGITFFVLAVTVGLDRFRRRDVVLAAVAFAVFPVWTGLIATVALSPNGQSMMFPLTFTTVTLSLIGHLIFGTVLGFGFWHSRAVHQHWPWPMLSAQLPVRVPRLAGLVAAGQVRQGRHAAGWGGSRSRVPAMSHGMSRATYEEWQRRCERRSSGLDPAGPTVVIPPRPRMAPDPASHPDLTAPTELLPPQPRRDPQPRRAPAPGRPPAYPPLRRSPVTS